MKTKGQKKYAEKLKDERWKDKRLQILQKDNNQCCNCGSKDNLSVHHLYYNGNDPWDYPDKALITLCTRCHLQEHSGKTSADFTRKKAKSIIQFPFYKRADERTYNELVNNQPRLNKKRERPKITKMVRIISAKDRQAEIARKNKVNRIGCLN